MREVDDERHRALRLAEEYRDSEKKSRKKQRDISRSAEDENQRLQVHNSYIDNKGLTVLTYSK